MIRLEMFFLGELQKKVILQCMLDNEIYLK